jgi:hypothetical protein
MTLPPLDKDLTIFLLAEALNKVNRTIFAVGAPLGSDAYFEIRKECVDTLSLCGIDVEMFE